MWVWFNYLQMQSNSSFFFFPTCFESLACRQCRHYIGNHNNSNIMMYFFTGDDDVGIIRQDCVPIQSWVDAFVGLNKISHRHSIFFSDVLHNLPSFGFVSWYVKMWNYTLFYPNIVLTVIHTLCTSVVLRIWGLWIIVHAFIMKPTAAVITLHIISVDIFWSPM